MKKANLRREFKEKRANLSSEEIEDLSLEIANKSLELPIWNREFYHLFLSITENLEINTEYLLHILQGKDKHVIVPKSDLSNGAMTGYLLTDQTAIKKNKWNIPEPVDGIPIPAEKVDVIFIPLLAFDENGHRIGYGKGFYDRYLAECRDDILKIGLSFFEPVTEISEIFETDVALDYCVTPEKIYTFGK